MRLLDLEMLVRIWPSVSLCAPGFVVSIEATSILTRGGRSGNIYNIGTGHGLSINELIPLISTTLGCAPKVIFSAGRPVDVPRNVLNHAKLSKETDWEPKTAIGKGIELTKQWLETLHATAL